MRLYELGDMMETVINDGLVFDEETGEVIFDADSLEELEATFDKKLESCLIKAKEFAAMRDALAKEADALAKRAERYRKKAETLKAYVVEQMERVGKGELETPRVKAKVRSSEYVSVYDELSVPPDYYSIKTDSRLSKVDIMKALRAGKTVPGASIEKRLHLFVE